MTIILLSWITAAWAQKRSCICPSEADLTGWAVLPLRHPKKQIDWWESLLAPFSATRFISKNGKAPWHHPDVPVFCCRYFQFFPLFSWQILWSSCLSFFRGLFSSPNLAIVVPLAISFVSTIVWTFQPKLLNTLGPTNRSVIYFETRLYQILVICFVRSISTPHRPTFQCFAFAAATFWVFAGSIHLSSLMTPASSLWYSYMLTH